MKQVIVSNGLRELAVRPPALFDEYIAFLAEDISNLFRDRCQFVVASCPGCGGQERRSAFSKLTFTYVACVACGSVFVSPRPTASSLKEFMLASRAVRFWQSTVEVETARERDQSIFSPRVAWVEAGVGDTRREKAVLIDLYSKYPRFLRSIARSETFGRVISLAPLLESSAISGDPAFSVEQDLDRLLASGISATAVTALECLERDVDPEGLIRAAARLLQDGGLLFLTSVTWSGFDLQVLREHSKNILPPTHLNLLSLEGIRQLLSRHDFHVVELSTPGQLDTEIVVHAVAENPNIPLPPFVDELIRRREEYVHRAFQEFLQEALLSSHVRLVARKGGAS